jgi:hypothetical protein
LNGKPIFLSVFLGETLINPDNSERITPHYVHPGSNLLPKPEGKTVLSASVTGGLEEDGGFDWLRSLLREALNPDSSGNFSTENPKGRYQILNL